MSSADALRLLAIIFSLLACATMPLALNPFNRPSRVWLLIVAIELLWLSAMVSVADSWGQAIRWYRTPLILSASIIGGLYSSWTIWGRS